nr:RDD family protein [Halomarina oriensis]
MVALSDRVVRTYRPRWLRAPGVTEEHPDATRDGWEPGVPARLSTRAKATIVDVVGVCLAVAVGAVVTARLYDVVAAFLVLDAFAVAVYAGVVASASLYFVVLEARWGQTLGKRAVGVVVTDADGAPPATWRVVVRNVLRPVDAVGFYLLGAVVAGITADRQRLGDLLAGTVVREKVSTSEPASASSGASD